MAPAPSPNLNKPQIVWLGLAGDIASLRRLHRASETFLLGFDIVTEQREFKPHITLGRARQPLQSPEINALVSLMRSDPVQARLTELAEPFRVDHLTLYRSHLSHEGATYEPLATGQTRLIGAWQRSIIISVICACARSHAVYPTQKPLNHERISQHTGGT